MACNIPRGIELGPLGAESLISQRSAPCKDQIGSQKFDPNFFPANLTKSVSKSTSDSVFYFFLTFSPHAEHRDTERPRLTGQPSPSQSHISCFTPSHRRPLKKKIVTRPPAPYLYVVASLTYDERNPAGVVGLVDIGMTRENERQAYGAFGRN